MWNAKFKIHLNDSPILSSINNCIILLGCPVIGVCDTGSCIHARSVGQWFTQRIPDWPDSTAAASIGDRAIVNLTQSASGQVVSSVAPMDQLSSTKAPPPDRTKLLDDDCHHRKEISGDSMDGSTLRESSVGVEKRIPHQRDSHKYIQMTNFTRNN